MDDLKTIVGKNLSALRKQRKLTQLELAEKLNYSDKAVSKWEQGATTPDLETLKQLCDFYGVTLDYLCNPNNIEHPHYDPTKGKTVFINHVIISCLLGMIIWMIANFIFIYPLMFMKNVSPYWIVFIWAVPISALVLLFVNTIYFKRNRTTTFIGVSILIWSTLTAVFLHFMFFSDQGTNLWLVFPLGAPMQGCITLWYAIKRK